MHFTLIAFYILINNNNGVQRFQTTISFRYLFSFFFIFFSIFNGKMIEDETIYY